MVGRDGWMHTGDTAVITEAGYGKIVGRMKDMVIRGGENIYPRLNLSWNFKYIHNPRTREIEEFLHGHPSIAEVQAIGVYDARLLQPLTIFTIFFFMKNTPLAKIGRGACCMGQNQR